MSASARDWRRAGAETKRIAPGAWLLPGFALGRTGEVLEALEIIAAAAPFRHWMTRGGFRMSVAMTNCGSLGWVSDRRGYRYDSCDPASGRPWPTMPPVFAELARTSALAGGFAHFEPDACLLNRYEPGARLSLHQDKDERDFGAPIVSISLGLPALFLFGGAAPRDPQRRVPLQHGDVVVWGGPARLNYHGICALQEGVHEALGRQRLNLTLRRAG
ncbi:MAG: DNA oxidative demethylase AlkB [Steroidobacteraceae bacterium]